MNIPKVIYGQVVTNNPDALWLREMRRLEHEGGEVVAYVVQTPKGSALALVSAAAACLARSWREAGTAHNADRPAAEAVA